MVRLLGVLLVWGGGTLWGVLEAARLRQRVRSLEDIARGLEQLERELTLRREALPALMGRVSKRETQQGRVLFSSCNEEISKGNSFTDAWVAALEKASLWEEERTLLGSLGQVLGRYDVSGQEESLSRLRKELDGLTRRARTRAAELGRVWCMLGMTAGGFLALALL